MKRAFEGAVSALCYAFIRAHFGARAGEPGPPWNNTVRFVLAQHSRMPDYLRLPFQVLTLLLVRWSGFPRPGSYRNLDPDRRWSRIARMRRSIFGPFRDLIRFYEGLAILGFHEEMARAEEAGRRTPAPATAGAAIAASAKSKATGSRITRICGS